MHYLSARKNERGFTLVEMLVIAPIVLLMISGFIVLMVSMVGNVLATRDQNVMSYESQDALNRIEQDTRLSIGFSTTTGTLLAPQGSNSNFTGTAAFTNATNTLILQQLATTNSPTNSTRELVYYANQPNPCGSNQTANQLFSLTVVYFIKDGSLWRRTILPLNNTSSNDANTVCKKMWQKDSCSPGFTNGRCQVNDTEVMKNIDRITVQYLTAPNGVVLSAANAASASTLKVTVEGKKNTAGRDIATIQAAIAVKINDAPTNVGPTPFAISQSPLDQTVSPVARDVKFVASANYSNATLQWQQSINGGTTWTNISGATNSTLTLATVDASMNNYKYRMVANNSSDTATSNTATLSVAWGDIAVTAGWVPFSAPGGYTQPGYVKTATGEVFLKGLIKSGTTTRDTKIATLPQEAWPSSRLLFYVETNNNIGRVDVLPNGEVWIVSGSASWVSLDTIHFMAKDSCTFTNLTLQSGWVNYAGFAPLAACKDSTTRVHVQGLVRFGAFADNTVIAALPAGFAPPAKTMIPSADEAAGTPTFAGVGLYSNGVVARGQYSSWLSVMGSTYPAAYGGWIAMPTLQNGWANFGAGHEVAEYTKSSDGVVSLQGLVTGGTATSNILLTTLPVGYRPSERLLFPAISNNANARLDILSNGQVILNLANTAWFSLGGISFVAER